MEQPTRNKDEEPQAPRDAWQDRRPLIVGIGGTASRGSSTEQAVAMTLAAVEAEGARTELFGGDRLCQLPLYDCSCSSRTPQQDAFLAAVRRADGFVVGTPAYHGGVSGVVKNALDLLEDTARDARPYLEGRAVGLVVTAYGWQATGVTLTSMRSIVHALRGWPTPLALALNATGGLFDEAGKFKDPRSDETVKLIAAQIMHFTQVGRKSEDAQGNCQSNN
jgi:FMN reductase